MKKQILFFFLFFCTGIIAPGIIIPEIIASVETPIEKERSKMGSLFGGGNGESGKNERGNVINLFGENKNNGINYYLWNASLDILGSIPISISDKNGGIIVTDWHKSNVENCDIKIQIRIKSSKLRSDSIEVKIFKRIKTDCDYSVDIVDDKKTISDLEEIILTRARDLRIKKKNSTR